MKTTTTAALLAIAIAAAAAAPASAYSGRYPLRWSCGSAKADISPKTGDLTIVLKNGRRNTVPFAWFEGGKMVTPWECEDVLPCALGDLQILGDDQPPVLSLYGFRGLPDEVYCEPRR